jgi:hypothetical protein
MGKVKEILSRIERNKGKVAKFFIGCATLKFFSSTLYRIYSNRESRTQMEATINIYCLFLVALIFLHEFLKCFLCKSLTDNIKIITHYKGKGITFILTSLIYMSHSMGTQQNYSAYLLFFVGIILLFVDCKFDGEKDKSPYEMAMERSKVKSQRSMTNLEMEPEIVVEVDTENRDTQKVGMTSEKKPIQVTSNPYDIPDDF